MSQQYERTKKKKKKKRIAVGLKSLRNSKVDRFCVISIYFKVYFENKLLILYQKSKKLDSKTKISSTMYNIFRLNKKQEKAQKLLNNPAMKEKLSDHGGSLIKLIDENDDFVLSMCETYENEQDFDE